MMTMLHFLAHFVTLPFKILAFYAIVLFRRVINAYKYSYRCKDREPKLDVLRLSYRAIAMELEKYLEPGPDGTPMLKTNPDHQPLRQGALCWSYQKKNLVDGLGNYIKDGVFRRGPGSPYDAPAAMPMAIAHGIMSLRRVGEREGLSLHYKFLAAVNQLMTKDMQIDKDTSTKCRLTSIGFDAAYALSLLYTAYRISNNQNYLRYANKILFLKGYALLLLTPVTYLNEKRRNFFIDHITMMGLHTAYHGCPNFFVRFLLRRAIRFVNCQSYHAANPYMCALAHECKALPAKQRKLVLDVHAYTDILKAAKHRDLVYTNSMPSDFSSHSDPEFLFDDIKGQGIETNSDNFTPVPLSGLCLAQSLAVLLNNKT